MKRRVEGSLCVLFLFLLAATTSSNAEPELTITKTGNPAVEPGGGISYSIRLVNTGDTIFLDAELVDQLPTHVSVNLSDVITIPAIGTVSEDPILHSIYWVGDVAMGEQLILYIEGTANSGLSQGDELDNVAWAADENLSATPTAQWKTAVRDTALFWNFHWDDGGFVGLGEWAYGSIGPSTGSPPYAHSEGNLWATNLGGNISVEPSNHILSATMAVPDDPQGIVLEWWDWFDEDEDHDVGSVRINQTEVYRIVDDQHAWTRHRVDLTPWCAQSVQLVFEYAASGTGEGGAGWYIDDVALYSYRRLSGEAALWFVF